MCLAEPETGGLFIVLPVTQHDGLFLYGGEQGTGGFATQKAKEKRLCAE